MLAVLHRDSSTPLRVVAVAFVMVVLCFWHPAMNGYQAHAIPNKKAIRTKPGQMTVKKLKAPHAEVRLRFVRKKKRSCAAADDINANSEISRYFKYSPY